MTTATRVSSDGDTRRMTARRGVALAGAHRRLRPRLPARPGVPLPLFLILLVLGAVSSSSSAAWPSPSGWATSSALRQLRGPVTAEVVRQALLGRPSSPAAAARRVQRRSRNTERERPRPRSPTGSTGWATTHVRRRDLHNEVTKVDRYGGELRLLTLTSTSSSSSTTGTATRRATSLRTLGGSIRALARTPTSRRGTAARRSRCVAEMSHRGKEFMSIAAAAEADLRALLAIPADYKVLFLQGGASSQFAMVPMNLLRGAEGADYLNTGSWSKKAIAEARRFGTVNVAATTEDGRFTRAPAQSELLLARTPPMSTTPPTRPLRGWNFPTCRRPAGSRWWRTCHPPFSRAPST